MEVARRLIKGSPAARRTIIYGAAAVMSIALLARFHWLGPPYFTFPATIYDHVTPTGHDTAKAILLARRAGPLLPSGATVTMFRPSAPDDTTHFHTAVGLLIRQRVVSRTKRPEFIITVGEPLGDPGYRLVSEFPEGNLYSRR